MKRGGKGMQSDLHGANVLGYVDDGEPASGFVHDVNRCDSCEATLCDSAAMTFRVRTVTLICGIAFHDCTANFVHKAFYELRTEIISA